MRIYILEDGVEAGPYALADVQQRLLEGVASESDLARREGLDRWVPLGDLLKDVSPAPMPSDSEVLSGQITGGRSRRYKPTFFRILFLVQDGTLLSCLCCPALAFGFPAVMLAAQWDSPLGLRTYQYGIAYFLLFSSLLGPVLAVRRVRKIRRLLAQGFEVPGRITRRSRCKGSQTIDYEYSYQDQTYSGWLGLRAGYKFDSHVTVLLDPDDPKQSMLLDPFLRR